MGLVNPCSKIWGRSVNMHGGNGWKMMISYTRENCPPLPDHQCMIVPATEEEETAAREDVEAKRRECPRYLRSVGGLKGAEQS